LVGKPHKDWVTTHKGKESNLYQQKSHILVTIQ
jgi:hypothetical protein